VGTDTRNNNNKLNKIESSARLPNQRLSAPISQLFTLPDGGFRAAPPPPLKNGPAGVTRPHESGERARAIVASDEMADIIAEVFSDGDRFLRPPAAGVAAPIQRTAAVVPQRDGRRLAASGGGAATASKTQRPPTVSATLQPAKSSRDESPPAAGKST
jgi:hypothetical protein